MGMTLEELQAEGAKPHGMTLDELKAEGGRVHRESKYPQPRSMTEDDQAQGLMFGPASSDVPGEDQARLFGGLDVAAPELSIVEKQLKDPYANDVEFLKEAAPFAAGGVLGKGAGALLGRMAAAPAGAPLSKAADIVSHGLENSFTHGGSLGIFVKMLQALAPNALPAAISGGPRAALAGTAAAAPGGAAMGANMLAPRESPDEALQRVARMLMGGQPLGKPPQFPQGE